MGKKGTDDLIDLFGCEERREVLPPLTKKISRFASDKTATSKGFFISIVWTMAVLDSAAK